MWGWRVRVWKNGGGNIKLDPIKVIEIGSLGRESAWCCNPGVKRVLIVWIVGWDMDQKVPHSESSSNTRPIWFNVEERIQWLKQIRMLQQICLLRPVLSHTERIQKTLVSPILREINLIGDHWHSWRPLGPPWNCCHWIGKLKCNGNNKILGCQVALNHHKMLTLGQKNKCSNQNSLTYMDLMELASWLISVPRSEIGSILCFYLIWIAY